ncbi:transmembrane protein 231-like [Thrips palmi]|uniref:Transmembrane protein 231 n=1 Tax=Thrips palmi TaxID=161013 RepID=A0A6P8ZKT1_THRPL|nr:transmembrane protein 231-like [Thrips palmi]
MAVYEVFTQPVSYRYKTTLCSKATVVFVISSLFVIILPLVVSYRSNGFWLKSDIYQEQPDVKFTHDYLLVLETSIPQNPIQCRAQFSLNDNFQRHCLFKSYEEDTNRDGKIDFITVNVKVPLLRNESVYSVRLILALDFYISNICHLRMQSLAAVESTCGVPGAGLDVAADLRFTQKKPVDYRTAEALFSSSLLADSSSLKDLILTYSQRNYSTTLINQYNLWASGRDEDEPFPITLRIAIPESSIVYRPGFWQVVKWAWIQYLSVFIVFLHVMHILQEYIFSNQLVPTFRSVPWKKIH